MDANTATVLHLFPHDCSPSLSPSLPPGFVKSSKGYSSFSSLSKTPLTLSTATHERDMNHPGRYDSIEYEESIIQDFQDYRVLIDIEDFIKHVLHIPDEWRTQWGPEIKKIKAENRFRSHHQCHHSDIERDSPSAREHACRGPFMDLGNIVLDVVSEFFPSHLQFSESTLVDESSPPGLEPDGGFVKTVDVMC